MTMEDGAADPVWQPAIALLDDITRRTEAGAVVRASYRAGLLQRLSTPSSIGELTSGVAVEESRLDAALEVLRSHGIASNEGETWLLTPPWAAVLAGQSPVDLAGYLEGPRVRMMQFERCLTGAEDYWQLPQQERLLVARSVSFNPASPFMYGMLRRDLGLLDGVVAALESGGHVLELGCGVGSRLTALALTFPTLRAVGVELDSELAAYGRHRAEQLGVGDRVTYVVGDATRYEPDCSFDLVNWSQFFFPSPTRAAALATAWSALRPGGWVTAPVIWADQPSSLLDEDAQDLALEGLTLDMWDVPKRTVGEARAELQAAGFVDTRVDDMSFVMVVRGRRPPG
jgi:SAM-dependent methyltransferase